MSLLDQYWTGIHQRLRAEVDVFAKLIAHNAEKGRENELALARMLGALLPTRTGVGTGLIVDSGDRYSKQTDVVLFDQSDEVLLFAQTSQLLFPVEVVDRCIEVKTTLQADDLADVEAKGQSLAALQSTAAAGPPPLALLAYRSQLKVETLADRLSKLDPAPDVVCVLSPGVVGGERAAGVFDGAPGPYDLARVLVGSEEGDGYVEVPADLEKEAVYGGQVYPKFPVGDARHLGDPARALLLFVEALLVRQASRRGRPVPLMSTYMNDGVRRLWWTGQG